VDPSSFFTWFFPSRPPMYSEICQQTLSTPDLPLPRRRNARGHAGGNANTQTRASSNSPASTHANGTTMPETELHQISDHDTPSVADPSEEPSYSNSNWDLLQEPVYPGATLSFHLAALCLFQLVAAHALSDVAMDDILRLCNVLIPQPSSLPNSYARLKKIMDPFFPKVFFCTDSALLSLTHADSDCNC
jgi:hypothetical protein